MNYQDKVDLRDVVLNAWVKEFNRYKIDAIVDQQRRYGGYHLHSHRLHLDGQIVAKSNCKSDLERLIPMGCAMAVINKLRELDRLKEPSKKKVSAWHLRTNLRLASAAS